MNKKYAAFTAALMLFSWMVCSGDELKNPVIQPDCPSGDESDSCCPNDGPAPAEGQQDLSCAWLKIYTGRMRPGTSLPSGYFTVEIVKPSPGMYSPSTLQYVLGYGITGVSKEKTSAGVPRTVHMLDKTGRLLAFRFDDGNSMGVAYVSLSEDMRERLLMVDAEGWATTNNPAYYDLYPGDGSKFRYGAFFGQSGYLQLVEHVTSRGRVERLADIDVDVVRDANDVIRQVRMPDGLADVVIETSEKYRIDFYTPDLVASGKDTNGLYTVISGATPFTKWIIQNPNPGTMDKLKVTKAVGSKLEESTYSYLADSDRWDLEKGEGADKFIKTQDKMFSDDKSRLIITKTVCDSALEQVSKNKRTYELFGSVYRLMESTVYTDADSGNAKQYDYNRDKNSAVTYGKKVYQKDADGNWTSYSYNNQGYISKEIKPWKNTEYSANDSQNSAVSFDYIPVAEGDGGGYSDVRPRTTLKAVNGIVIEKRFNAYITNAVREYTEVEEIAAGQNGQYGFEGNLRRETVYYGTNNIYHVGRIKTKKYPDGRLDSHFYDYGFYHASATNPAESYFEVNADGAALKETIVHGTVTMPDGIANRTTRETRVLDERSRNVLNESYVYTGSGYERISWNVREYDAQSRLIKDYMSDGRLAEQAWGSNCCGKASDVTAEGIERAYTYDSLNRLYTVTKKCEINDLIVRYSYNAAGRRISESITSADLSMLVSSNAYDLAGQLTNSVDSTGISTTYSYYNDGRRVVTVRAGLTNETENYADGRVMSQKIGGKLGKYYDYGINADGTQWTVVYTGPAGTNSPMWTKTTTDLLGRTIQEERPGFGNTTMVNTFVYNSKGQLVKSTATGLPDTLYEYNDLSEQVRSGLDIDGNGILNLAGMDRITENDTYFEKTSSDWFKVSVSELYAQDNSAVATTNSIQKTKLTGLGSQSEIISADILGNLTVSRAYLDRDNKKVTQTVAYPDSTNNASQITINGLLVSSTSKTGIKTDFGYDLLERRTSVTDPRTGASITHYNNKGQVDYVEDAATNRTSYVYSSDTGRQIAVSNALGDVTFTEYNLEGQVVGTWGATYPVLYDYDDFNRMTAMYTLRSTNVVVSDYSGLRSQISSFDKTSWLYDQPTGLLTNKVYADGKGPSYSYTSDGKLASRKWARTSDGGANLATSYSYSNSGELVGIDYSDSTPDVSFIYNRLGQQKTITDGQGARAFTYNDALQLASETNALGLITRNYDSLGRSAGFTFGTDYYVTYGFAGDGRFNSVSSSVQSVSSVVNYSYLPNSDLISVISNSVNSVNSVKRYESNRNLITSIQNMSGTNLVSQFDYINDQIGRRTQRVDTLAVTNSFGYNLKSELVAASMGTNSYNYWYDNIGNRESATNNGETTTYTANSLNQYTSIINGGLKILSYDLDGNLTNDSVFTYTWDCENRLIGVSSNGSEIASYKYDYMGRRYEKTVNGVTNQFVYDGWAMIQEQNSAGVKSYVYGLDLSGTLQGAGTISGILMANLNGTNAFFCYDANGNVTDLVGSNGNPSAHYEFDPYGNTIVKTGALADANSYRFSTKYTDSETGLLYYGFRFYSTKLSRWISRDPIGEQGGKNLYGFVRNNPIKKVDKLGLEDWDWGPWDDPQNYDNADDAAKAAGEYYLPETRRNQIEHCGNICKKCSDYITTHVEGWVTANGQHGCNPYKAPCPDGWEQVGWWHTQDQPWWNFWDSIEDEFSVYDRNYSEGGWGPGYLTNPDGTGRYDPSSDGSGEGEFHVL